MEEDEVQDDENRKILFSHGKSKKKELQKKK